MSDMEIPSIIQEPNHVWKLWLPRAIAVREGRMDGCFEWRLRDSAHSALCAVLPVRRSCLVQSSIESHFLKVKDVLIIGKLPQKCEKSDLYVFCLHPCSENVNSATVLRVSVCVCV